MERDYIIYKIECKTTLEDGYVYVGSTCNLATRKYNHKSRCCNETSRGYNLKLYETIRANGGWENWEMKPVEELKVTKRQAEIREQYWIDHFKSVLNGIRACQDAEITKGNKKKYSELHRDEYNKKQREKRLANKINV